LCTRGLHPPLTIACTSVPTSSAPPHALPPFPTRRSSDLLLRRAGHRGSRATRCIRREFNDGRHVSSLSCPKFEPPNFPPCPKERDRKSTRLNSSHEWISYAGFFLTKKTSYTVRANETARS